MLPIEAKRDRSEDSDEEERSNKEARTAVSTWYTDHAAAIAATEFFTDAVMFEGTADIDSDESLLANIDEVYSARMDILTSDVSHLAVFPHLQYLLLASNGEAATPLLDITMACTGMETTAVTKLKIRSRDSMCVVGMTPAFCASLAKITKLNIACPIRLLRGTTGAEMPSEALQALKRLKIGAMPHDTALARTLELESFIDVVETGTFAGLPALEKLTLKNMAASWPNGDTPETRRPLALAAFSPGLQTLRLRHMVANASAAWANALPKLHKVEFRNTAIEDVSGMEAFLRDLQHLKHVKFANTRYEVESEELEAHVFITEFSTITLHSMPTLESVLLEDVNVIKLQLGRHVFDEIEEIRLNPPLAALKDVRITSYTLNADDTYLCPRVVLETRRRPASFLPQLGVLNVDAHFHQDVWRHPNEIEPPLGYFPRFLLGIPALDRYYRYRGPLAWGHAPKTVADATDNREEVDVALWLMPGVTSFSDGYLEMLDAIVRANLLAVHFSSSHPILQHRIDVLYATPENVANRERRLAALRRKEEVARSAAEKAAARALAESQRQLVLAQRVEVFGERVRFATRNMEEAAAAALFKLIMEHAMERFTNVPRHRRTPYFVRYDPADACYAEPNMPLSFAVGTEESADAMERRVAREAADRRVRQDPYAVDSRGRQNTCPLCDDVFRPEDHAGDLSPIVDNGFLTQRNELELDMQLNRLGCIVTCNATPSDFARNNYVVQTGETPEQAVDRVQCVHKRHFFHRVCYAIALYDGYYTEDLHLYRCPHNNMRFFADVAAAKK